jgi:hypothetical protein
MKHNNIYQFTAAMGIMWTEMQTPTPFVYNSDVWLFKPLKCTDMYEPACEQYASCD